MGTLVLGLGNPVLSDDSVGIKVTQALRGRVRPEVTVVESSVGGLDFLDLLAGYDKAIIVDAIQTENGKPGQIRRLEPEALKATRHVNNPHDLDFPTAIELGKKLNLSMPEDITIFGIEVQEVMTLSEDCTPEVEQAIPVCVDLVLHELQSED